MLAVFVKSKNNVLLMILIMKVSMRVLLIMRVLLVMILIRKTSMRVTTLMSRRRTLRSPPCRWALLTLYVNELLWHVEVPGVEGLVVGDVALRLGHGDHHVVPLLSVHLLGRDSPLEVVLLWGGGGGGTGVTQGALLENLSNGPGSKSTTSDLN